MWSDLPHELAEHICAQDFANVLTLATTSRVLASILTTEFIDKHFLRRLVHVSDHCRLEVDTYPDGRRHGAMTVNITNRMNAPNAMMRAEYHRGKTDKYVYRVLWATTLITVKLLTRGIILRRHLDLPTGKIISVGATIGNREACIQYNGQTCVVKDGNSVTFRTEVRRLPSGDTGIIGLAWRVLMEAGNSDLIWAGAVVAKPFTRAEISQWIARDTLFGIVADKISQ